MTIRFSVVAAIETADVILPRLLPMNQFVFLGSFVVTSVQADDDFTHGPRTGHTARKPHKRSRANHRYQWPTQLVWLEAQWSAVHQHECPNASFDEGRTVSNWFRWGLAVFLNLFKLCLRVDNQSASVWFGSLCFVKVFAGCDETRPR